MSELWSAYWPVLLVGLLIGIIVGYLVFRPRQRVTLSDTAPLRPHMSAPDARVASPTPSPARAPAPAGEGRSLVDEAAAAASDVAGHVLGSDVHGELPGAGGAPDDLQRMKGVGPKLAGILNAHGLTRFEEIASLSPGQIEALDADLGAFRGRLTRDRIVEQAQYLVRGDLDGYKTRFGAL